ncbi:MAG: bifunctional demethylmenaquinone methyltransferase/2-methoxy-6-polyprenyl-1,4-benzoquinol methylase UbiE [Flavobacteriales bacterium]
MSKITPYNTTDSKKKQVEKMFDNIAKRYDLLNHSLSFGMDYYWRRKAIKCLTNNPKTILDVATGTADFAICAAKLKGIRITGIDISEGMINIGKEKVKRKGLEGVIELQIADSENLPFTGNSFDAITAGFGVRNFENLGKGLSEMHRVLNKNGIVAILEPSKPKKIPLKQIYNIYFHHVLPFFGKLVSKDNSAYTYLPNSVEAFPSGKDFIKHLENVGFTSCNHIPLTFGIVDLYIAIKK